MPDGPPGSGTPPAALSITASGRLRIEVENGSVAYVTEDGLLPGCGHREPSGLRWGDLHVGSVVGAGGQAIVHRAVHIPSGVPYALKVLRAVDGHYESVALRELAHLLDGPSHVNLVAYHQAFYRDCRLNILMEYMDCGDLRTLQQHTGPLPLPVLAAVTAQVLSGLESLHHRNIVHRDVKPSNVLLHSSGLAKISDFGIATTVPQSGVPYSDIAGHGSHAYMSPERLNAEDCGHPSDVWSLGLTVAQMALGVYPFLLDSASLDRWEVNLRDSLGSVGRPSDGSIRQLLSPVPGARPPVEVGRDWRPSPTHLAAPIHTTFLASPCFSGASASPVYGARRISGPERRRGNRESSETVVSSLGPSPGDGNPFHREPHPLELSLMLQDPRVRVDFDRVIPLVRQWHPEWPPADADAAVRSFTDCCVAHDPDTRWTCAQLVHHPLLDHALRVAELGEWLRGASTRHTRDTL